MPRFLCTFRDRLFCFHKTLDFRRHLSCISLLMLAFSFLRWKYSSNEPTSFICRTFHYHTTVQAVFPASVSVFLVPIHYRRQPALSMIFNAFFKEWLLPSLSLDSLHRLTSLNTYTLLWDLSLRSGLFPSRPWTLSPKVCLFLICISMDYTRLRSFPNLRKVSPPIQTKVLYL